MTIAFAYINPEHRKLDFEILFGDYDPGTINVDVAKPGVILEHRPAGKWEPSLSLFQGLALSIAGIRYDPTVTHLSEIANELRNIKRIVATESGAEDNDETLEVADEPATATNEIAT